MDFLTHHLLRAAVGRTPQKEALVCGSERLTYAELDAQIRRVAHALRAAGVRRGDRVRVHLPPSTALAVSILGISQAGGVFGPIHHDLFPQQVAYIARDCAMKGLMTDAGRFRTLIADGQDLPTLEFAAITNAEEAIAADITTYSLASWREQATLGGLADVGMDTIRRIQQSRRDMSWPTRAASLGFSGHALATANIMIVTIGIATFTRGRWMRHTEDQACF